MQARNSYNVVLIGEDAKIGAFIRRSLPEKLIYADVGTINLDGLTLVIHDTRGTERFLNMLEKQIKQADVIVCFNTGEQQKSLIQKAKPECIVLRFPQLEANQITPPFCMNYLSTITTKIHDVEAGKKQASIASFISLNPITSATVPLIFKANLPVLGNFSIFRVLPKEVVSIIALKLKELEQKPKEIENQPEKSEICSIQ